jgi:phosphopantothenoylcysteine decarboxylase/phosphopantothenate--cysteine ligase
LGFDTYQVTIISKNGNQEVVPLKSKTEVAKEIVVFISKEINA